MLSKLLVVVNKLRVFWNGGRKAKQPCSDCATVWLNLVPISCCCRAAAVLCGVSSCRVQAAKQLLHRARRHAQQCWRVVLLSLLRGRAGSAAFVLGKQQMSNLGKQL